jgi:hypothetical protein
MPMDTQEKLHAIDQYDENTPLETLKEFMRDSSKDVRKHLAETLKSPEALSYFYHITDEPQTLMTIINNLYFPPEDMKRVAHHPDHYMRLSLADHPYIPLEALDTLATDSSHFVVISVIQNPQVTDKIILKVIDYVSKVTKNFSALDMHSKWRHVLFALLVEPKTPKWFKVKMKTLKPELFTALNHFRS